jgi:hypothetical protein
MSVKEVADSFAGYLYSRFIMRDFAYLGSGAAFLFVVSHLLGLRNQILTNTTTTLMFFGAAYFTGILMQEACIFLRLFQMTTVNGPEGKEEDKDNWPLNLHQLYTYVHPAALVAIERTIYLKQVAAAFGSAAFFGVLFALIHGVAIWLFLDTYPSPLHLHCWTVAGGIILFFFCREENRIKRDLQFWSVKLLKSRYVPKNDGAIVKEK